MSQAPDDGCTNFRNMLSSKQWNNKASDTKLVSLYSTSKMMHGPINIRLCSCMYVLCCMLSHCYFLLFVIYQLLDLCFLMFFLCLFSVLCVCVLFWMLFVLFCVIFLLLHTAVPLLFIYKFTDHRHRLETQLQQINIDIISYHTISQCLCNPRHKTNNPNDIPRSCTDSYSEEAERCHLRCHLKCHLRCHCPAVKCLQR